MTFNPFSALTSKIFGGALLAALLACALLYVNGRHYQKLYDQRGATIEQFKIAQKAADAAARKAIADTEARYKEKANAAETSYSVAVAAARSDADAYLAAHRVPACPGGATRPAAAGTQGSSASVPADLSASAIVGDADVRACSALAAYSLKAHAWALTLNDPQ